jgi:hypothetical protein
MQQTQTTFTNFVYGEGSTDPHTQAVILARKTRWDEHEPSGTAVEVVRKLRDEWDN